MSATTTDRHKHKPKAVRIPDALLSWFRSFAASHDRAVNAVMVEALEEYKDRRETTSP